MSNAEEDPDQEDDFFELAISDACPCNSGETYGECCVEKAYRFGKDRNGTIVRRVSLEAPWAEEFESVRESFEALYGRKVGEEDLIFGHVMDPTESVFSTARELMTAGLPAKYAYAYTRTDGLLLTELNMDFVSEADIDRFSYYVEEFEEALSETPSSGEVNALTFILHTNAILDEIVQEAAKDIKCVLTDFLSRHMSADQASARMYPMQRATTSMTVKTPLDYAIFSALKGKTTLNSVERLIDAGIPESIYALARSLFENTLFLDGIGDDDSLFWDSIGPKANTEEYEFGLHPDGRTNFNFVVHRSTGRRVAVNPKVTQLALDEGRPKHVADLYSLFYVVACQYAHVDVLSAPLYFDDPDPFDELDRVIVSGLVALVLAGDLLRALSRVPGVRRDFRDDVCMFLQRLRETLSLATQLVLSDPEHPSDLFATLEDVLSGWE